MNLATTYILRGILDTPVIMTKVNQIIIRIIISKIIAQAKSFIAGVHKIMNM